MQPPAFFITRIRCTQFPDLMERRRRIPYYYPSYRYTNLKKRSDLDEDEEGEQGQFFRLLKEDFIFRISLQWYYATMALIGTHTPPSLLFLC